MGDETGSAQITAMGEAEPWPHGGGFGRPAGGPETDGPETEAKEASDGSGNQDA